MVNNPTPGDIDEYIAGFPHDVRAKLEKIRAVILEAAPGATEKISYRMPTFVLEGNLVHFAAYEHHIGFYPTPSAIEKFSEELKGYRGGKGSVQYPLDQPVPYDLVREIVAFRVSENLETAERKRRKKK